MDGTAAIERNRVALLRIAAMLVAMAGLRPSAVANRQSENATDAAPSTPTANCPLPIAATLPRHLWRAILRLLRPAESAARRLIIAAARGMTPPPPRFTQSPAGPGHLSRPSFGPPASQGVSGRFAEGKSAVPAARWKASERRAEHREPGRDVATGDGGVSLAQHPHPRRIALPLFDRLRRVGPRPLASRDLPRICVPGWTGRLPVPVRRDPSPDDPITGARLALRLDALARALDDLPRQARRFARWQAAAHAAAGAQMKDHAASDSSPPSTGGEVVRCADRSGGRTFQPPAAPLARFRRLSPLRGGPPPGGRRLRYDPARRRRSGTREIDEILAHAHELATHALERPDTS